MDAPLARIAAFAALLLAAPDAGARGRGYSVEAAAGAGSGSSVQTGYDSHPYHPFRDFGKTAGGGGPEVVNRPTGDQDSGDTARHPERNGIDPRATVEWVKPEASPEAPKAEPKDEPAPREVSAADAAANFPALVETFFRKEGDDGVWTFADGKAARRFVLVSAEVKRLRKVGPGVFAGPALLRELSTRKPVVAEVVADYSKAEWTVVSVRPAAAPAAKKASAQR
ncbi:MAG: hypothetical protein HY079_13620 [Elusimicrobia bacterium]|nr:hypothetical protein [Elusimicrobiota bacterium]